MANYSKVILSGSTNGLGIKLTTTGATGDLIHTAEAGTTDPTMDLVTLYAVNEDTISHVVTLEWGGTTAPDNEIKFLIPAQSGLFLIALDLPLRNSLVVHAYADLANKVVIYGSVSRIA